MANPFSSGRIPPGLADKIDAHLLATGETRSELLVRLLRAEVDDNNCDNNVDNIVDNTLTDVVIRLERLERLLNNKTDNKRRTSDDKPDNTDDSQPSGEDWVNLLPSHSRNRHHDSPSTIHHSPFTPYVKCLI